MQLSGIKEANSSIISTITQSISERFARKSPTAARTRKFGRPFMSMLEQMPYGNLTVSEERLYSNSNNNNTTTTNNSNNNIMSSATATTTTTEATAATTSVTSAVTISSLSTAGASSLNDSNVINRLADVTIGTHFEPSSAMSANVSVDPAASSPWNITYVSVSATSYNNCSALFANYTQPQAGIYCNWTWDSLLCWPPTPAGVLARMNCPAGYHGVDPRKFANRKCELDGHWGGRPNETEPNPAGWTDYGPCYKPEVIRLMQEIKDVNLYMDIAQRTRTLEIIGLCLSLLALIISLVIFCAFRSLRNNRTKIHKNLFIAMVLQVIVRLTLYLDQFRRGKPEAATNASLSVIENTPYLCEASYVLLEYARTAMFMWMFIEGLYLHNMITVAVFQGSFPLIIFSLLGWGMPVVMTTVWVQCTAIFMDTSLGDCMWNYNLTPYYWILEGPRLTVILLNFFFLVNIIRVLVVKLRQSQASDIEQTRKAVRAAIVLLPLLGITNLLHLVPALKTAWKFAVWSYVTHFLTSFQGFFIALIYCFLNGEVRTVLLKSLAVWMSVRGHPEWVPKRASMYSGAYNTAPDTDALQQPGDAPPPATTASAGKRVSPPNKRLNCRKASSVSIVIAKEPQRQRLVQQQQQQQQQRNNNNSRNIMPDDEASASATRIQIKDAPSSGHRNWMIGLCFRSQKQETMHRTLSGSMSISATFEIQTKKKKQK
ncbi:PDF receptor isoform X3 [Drosophila sulfurigaster albostrigata]|uniref:PDF receptor isoform X3 n=1 Tax=Drosophila sulfurigaster albostrigata TaxID=89887 RepID=UPI002D21A670|nr:PDF receptor isoform X3 [Drosophila sulfurigaster albostrigata]